MAPRQRVCHSVANARLISRLMSPRDVLLLPAGLFSTNRGHSVFSNQPTMGKNNDKRVKMVIRMQYECKCLEGKLHC